MPWLTQPGNCLWDIGQYDKAISDYTKAIETDPKFAVAYYSRGMAYRQKGQYDQAISDYTKAIETDPKLAMAYNNRGIAYEHKGQYDQAMADCTKAIEIDPKLAVAYYNRGRIFYYFKKEYDKSWEDVKRAQNLDYQVPPKFLEDLRKVSGTQK